MKKLENNNEINFSKEMGLTQEEMNQIVGGTTFTGELDMGEETGTDICQQSCLICKSTTTIITICDKGCKSKSKKMTEEFTN